MNKFKGELCFVTKEEPEVVETPKGRFYSFSGKTFPSITTVLGQTADKSGLEEWKNRIGEEEAARISKTATTIGYSLHLLFEDWFIGKQPEKAEPKAKMMFNLLRPIVSRRVTKIYGIEFPLYSEELAVAGRTDLICEFDGEPMILDWKSNHGANHKKEEWTLDYRLQTCFYARAFNERNLLPQKIKKGVIAFGNVFAPQIIVFEIEKYSPELEKRVEEFRKI